MARPPNAGHGGLGRLGDEVRAELSRFGPQAGMADLVDRWPAAVGPAIAGRAWPATIARDGTVNVNTADSVWAFELGQRMEEIADRLGVSRLRFAPGPLPPAEEKTPTRPVEPGFDDLRQAREVAAGISDEKLRETVQRAVSFGLARARSDRAI